MKALRKRNGIYYARIQIHPTDREIVRTLKTRDKEVALKRINEMFQQMEREAEGIAIPAKIKQAAQLPIGKHLRQYLIAKEAEWTSDQHANNSRRRIEKMIQECGWNKLADIDSFSFTQWRSMQSIGPKTLNEYLSALNQFVEWLTDNGFIEANPIVKVKRIKVRGRKSFERRAFSLDEINRLLKAVKDKPNRLGVYLAAIHTGLRRGELVGLEWGDVNLKAEVPFLSVRASTTKNGKDAVIPLHPDLLHVLMILKQKEIKANDPIFRVPVIETFREDLKKAGIEYVDERGHRADFHALRKTFGTLMQLSGVNPRTAQELMRHSDSKLTMQIYTDANLLPTVAAIHSLPSLINVPSFVPENVTNHGTNRDRESQTEVGEYPLQCVENEMVRGDESRSDSREEMVLGVGFEPTRDITPTRPSTLRVYQFHHPSGVKRMWKIHMPLRPCKR